jgi:hypothetical protein
MNAASHHAPPSGAIARLMELTTGSWITQALDQAGLTMTAAGPPDPVFSIIEARP